MLSDGLAWDVVEFWKDFDWYDFHDCMDDDDPCGEAYMLARFNGEYAAEMIELIDEEDLVGGFKKRAADLLTRIKEELASLYN